MKFNNYPELINHHKEHIKIDWAIDEKTGIPKKSNDKEILLAHTDATEDNLEHIIKAKLVDLIHPIGSVIMTTNPNFDPAAHFGGAWTKWTDGYLKVDNTPSSNVQGSYIITSENMPLHNHYYTPNGTVTVYNGIDAFVLKGIDTNDSDDNGYTPFLNSDKSGATPYSTINTGAYSYTFDYSSDNKITHAFKNANQHNHAASFSGIPSTTSNAGYQSPAAFKPQYYAVIAWQRTA